MSVCKLTRVPPQDVCAREASGSTYWEFTDPDRALQLCISVGGGAAYSKTDLAANSWSEQDKGPAELEPSGFPEERPDSLTRGRRSNRIRPTKKFQLEGAELLAPASNSDDDRFPLCLARRPGSGNGHQRSFIPAASPGRPRIRN